MNIGEFFASGLLVTFAVLAIAASFALFGQPRPQTLARNVILTAVEPLAVADCGAGCLPRTSAMMPSPRPAMAR